MRGRNAITVPIAQADAQAEQHDSLLGPPNARLSQAMCSERQRLMEAYVSAVHQHAQIVDTFTSLPHHENFRALLRSAEAARITAYRARIVLENHLSRHGCENAPV